jgi:hypothetical protein
MAGSNGLHGFPPGSAFAFPDPPVKIRTVFMVRAITPLVALNIPITKAVMLSSAKGPHVVKGPDNRLIQSSYFFNAEGSKPKPVKME